MLRTVRPDLQRNCKSASWAYIYVFCCYSIAAESSVNPVAITHLLVEQLDFDCDINSFK